MKSAFKSLARKLFPWLGASSLNLGVQMFSSVKRIFSLESPKVSYILYSAKLIVSPNINGVFKTILTILIKADNVAHSQRFTLLLLLWHETANIQELIS